MSTLPTPIPGQPASGQPMTPPPAAPALSEPERLMNTFIAPSKTFEDLRRNPSWWVPFVVSAVFGIIFGIVAVQKLDLKRFIQQQNEQSPRMQKQMEQMSAAQREQMVSIQANVAKVIFYVSPIFSLIIGLIAALVLWVIFSFIFGAEVGFGRAMAVVFYAFLPAIIATIMLTISFLLSSDPNTIDLNNNPMPTNPAFFMDPQGNKFLYGLISGLDVFKIWIVALLGLGFAKASSNRKPSTATALITMFVIYAVLVIAGAGIKAAFA